MKIKVEQLIKILLIFAALLPLQLTLRTVLHFPSYLLLIYIFIFIGGVFVCFFRKKLHSISKFQASVLIILLIFFCEMLISVLYNYPDIIDKKVHFEYYVSKYSSFWDSALMSSLFAGIIRPIVYFTFSYILLKLIQTEKQLKLLCKSLILLGFISSLYSIYQIIAYKFGLPFSALFSGHSDGIIEVFGVRRCEGLFYEPGPQASYLSVVFSLMLFYLMFKYKNLKKIYGKLSLFFVFFTITVALFLTLSPIGILTPIISILFLSCTKWNTFSKYTKIAIIAIPLVILLVFGNIKIGENSNSLSNYLIDRIYALKINNDNFNGESRSVRNEVGTKIIKDHMWLGVGPGNDGFYYSQYAPFALGRFPDKGIVLNNNLKILSDSGILGFICYIFILLYPAYFYYFKKKLNLVNNNNFIDYLIEALFLSEFLLVVLTFNSQVEFFQPLFWLTYSMLISAISIKLRNTKAKIELIKRIKYCE